MVDTFLFKNEGYKIIGLCMEVHNNLGNGFLESVYQECLELEFLENTIPYRKECEISIFYKNKLINKKFVADFICYDEIIIETKAVKCLLPEHEAQILNYLKSTRKRVGYLINFGGSSLEYRRFIL